VVRDLERIPYQWDSRRSRRKLCPAAGSKRSGDPQRNDGNKACHKRKGRHSWQRGAQRDKDDGTSGA